MVAESLPWFLAKPTEQNHRVCRVSERIFLPVRSRGPRSTFPAGREGEKGIDIYKAERPHVRVWGPSLSAVAELPGHHLHDFIDAFENTPHLPSCLYDQSIGRGLMSPAIPHSCGQVY